MNILFSLNHPAHFYLFRKAIKELKSRGYSVHIVIKKKDILEKLIDAEKWNYTNILPNGRKDNRLSIALGLLEKDFQLYKYVHKQSFDLMIGTSVEITHVGRLRGIPSIVVNEDDHDVVPLFAKLAYPFSQHVLAPQMCTLGKWENKRISYNSYHELAYLHPQNFTPDKNILEKLQVGKQSYYILRFSDLGAHHDFGKKGISNHLAEKIIKILEPHGKVIITSERELPAQFEPYRMKIDPIDIHHALNYATIYIGDSQTMAAEAAVLGTPSIRFNDFVGKIGYLEELEHRYDLTVGIKTNESSRLIETIKKCVVNKSIKKEWLKKRKKMLADKINLSAFMVWLFENYPASVVKLKEEPDFQYTFK